MTPSSLLRAAAALALVAGCNNNNNGSDGGADLTAAPADMTVLSDMTSLPDMTPPAPPMIGAQIDRMGRGAINVAVTNPFDLAEPNGNRNMTRDKYNADGNQSGWVAAWSPQLQINLAIYDGADTVCGNQALACGMLTGCPAGTAPAQGRYQALANLLADDQLYLDTSQAMCGAQYLAVEISAAGLAVPDCGGRTPTKSENVVHFMYTAATVGAVPISMGMYPVTDGVSGDMDGTNVSLTTFPFLDNPN